MRRASLGAEEERCGAFLRRTRKKEREEEKGKKKKNRKCVRFFY